jgi:hypothetical protein
MIERFSPALARTFVPGAPIVPLAERVMVPIFRSSTAIMSKRRARSVLVFSVQSLRRSVSRAFRFAIASLTSPRRWEPRRARASFRSSRAFSRSRRPGACNNSPVDNAADTATPRSTPTACPVPGAGIGSGIAANATCQRPALSRVMRYDFTPANSARPPEPHPAHLRHPHLADAVGQRHTSSADTATIRNPSPRPGLRHVGRRWVPPKKFAMAWAKSLSACCCTMTDPWDQSASAALHGVRAPEGRRRTPPAEEAPAEGVRGTRSRFWQRPEAELLGR